MQKWKLGLPGSPIGQQQGVARGCCDLEGEVMARRGGIGSGVTDGDKGGSVGPCVRRGGVRRGVASPSERLMGEGRDGRFNRCAFPTTAFLEIFKQRPISAVDNPSAQRLLRRAIASSVHSIWYDLPEKLLHKVVRSCLPCNASRLFFESFSVDNLFVSATD